MNHDLNLDARTLDKGRIRRIHETRPFGHRIECLSGSLWITQDGDSRDIVLAPGAYVQDIQVSPQSTTAQRLYIHGGGAMLSAKPGNTGAMGSLGVATTIRHLNVFCGTGHGITSLSLARQTWL